MRTSYDAKDVARLIDELVARLAGAFDPARRINIIGIRTRGETLAHRIVDELKKRGFSQIGFGVLDITLYRDDLSEVGPVPMVRPTEIAIDLENVPLILVDDVLFTGRSVRAALGALNDFGRPSAIRLAVLVDRGGRELPIQADFVALVRNDVPTTHRVAVKLKETDGVDEIVIEPRSQG